MEDTIDLKKYASHIASSTLVKKSGRVKRVIGLILEGDGPAVSVGSLCAIHSRKGNPPVDAQVVGFRDNCTLLMPMGDMVGI